MPRIGIANAAMMPACVQLSSVIRIIGIWAFLSFWVDEEAGIYFLE